MGLNSTPAANRIHIGFFGRRNAGKSSVVNAVTGQELAVVSDVKGTTTDPVYKSMELLPLGPVMIIDTPGFDDEGALGELRVKKTKQVLNKTDVAVLIVDATSGKQPCDLELIDLFVKKEIPYIVVYNKMDLLELHSGNYGTMELLNRQSAVDSGTVAELFDGENTDDKAIGRGIVGENAEKKEICRGFFSKGGSPDRAGKGWGEVGKTFDREQKVVCQKRKDLTAQTTVSRVNEIYVSALTGQNIYELKELIGKSAPVENEKLKIVGDLIHPSDFVVLVVPIDKAAPKGRLILPQQQTIRDILEADATAIVVKEFELRDTLAQIGKKPALVITDSQVFSKVSADVPRDILLTSFSILMARYKGFLDVAVEGVRAIEDLQDGDLVLISEGCTHHRQCDDIGTVKIPRWLRQYTGKEIRFVPSSGTEFPEDLSPYKMVIHCGGCMLNEREMKYRMKCSLDQGIPFTNYGITIAYLQGILKRAVEIFPHLYMDL